MNLEDNIKDVITQKLEGGVVEKIVAEQLEKGIQNALEDLFGRYGDITKVIEKEVKSVMVPYLENYDYSEYITKLDSVMTDVLKVTAIDNTEILTNFKELMTPFDKKEIPVSELFEKWTKHVAKNVETDGLEVEFDESPQYESVEVTFQVEYLEGRDWSSFDDAKIFFECGHDEKMNFELRINQWKKYDNDKWSIQYDASHDLESLRYLGDFEIFLMRLKQQGTKLILDDDYETDFVHPDAEPEADFR